LDDPDARRSSKIGRKIINLNARGTYFMTREVFKILRGQNSRIVNIASVASRSPVSDVSMYAGTKGMIESFTRNWALELPRKYGCTVNTVAPGVIGTEAYWAAPLMIRELLKPLIDATPVASRVGMPEEVAWAVAILCEEGSSWINGIYLPISGGGPMV
jgi:NAD(P)-dependent dehydrogenase (short-subunit alcohol dehydrogenase family)